MTLRNDPKDDLMEVVAQLPDIVLLPCESMVNKKVDTAEGSILWGAYVYVVPLGHKPERKRMAFCRS